MRVVHVVTFKRDEKAGWEDGLFIGREMGDDKGVIVDKNNQLVPAPVWDFTKTDPLDKGVGIFLIH